MKRSCQFLLGGALLCASWLWRRPIDLVLPPEATALGGALLIIAAAQLARLARFPVSVGCWHSPRTWAGLALRRGPLRSIPLRGEAAGARGSRASVELELVSRLGAIVEWAAVGFALVVASAGRWRGPAASTALPGAALLPLAVVASIVITVGLRRPFVNALTGFAGRFPGHLPIGVPPRIDRTLESLWSAPGLRTAVALPLFTSAAWSLECLAAGLTIEALGGTSSIATAMAVVLSVHLGMFLLPAALGVGATEFLGAGVFGGENPDPSRWWAVLLFHAGALLWTRGPARLFQPRPPGLLDTAEAPAKPPIGSDAAARRRRVDSFVAAAAPDEGPWLSVVIPAYNEEERIVATLRSVCDYLKVRRIRAEVIVVDDGSSDGTADLVEELARTRKEVRLLRQPRNLGKGAAVRAGMLAARGAWRMFSDADGSTPVEELERLLEAAARGAPISIGSRAITSADTHTERHLGRAVVGRIFAFLVNLWVVPGIADTQCGFKLFDRQSAEWLFPRQRLDRFAFDVEILYLARQKGLAVTEVPVNWSKVAGSKVDLIRDSSEMLWAILKLPSVHRKPPLRE